MFVKISYKKKHCLRNNRITCYNSLRVGDILQFYSIKAGSYSE